MYFKVSSTTDVICFLNSKCYVYVIICLWKNVLKVILLVLHIVLESSYVCSQSYKNFQSKVCVYNQNCTLKVSPTADISFFLNSKCFVYVIICPWENVLKVFLLVLHIVRGLSYVCSQSYKTFQTKQCNSNGIRSCTVQTYLGSLGILMVTIKQKHLSS